MQHTPGCPHGWADQEYHTNRWTTLPCEEYDFSQRGTGSGEGFWYPENLVRIVVSTGKVIMKKRFLQERGEHEAAMWWSPCSVSCLPKEYTGLCPADCAIQGMAGGQGALAGAPSLLQYWRKASAQGTNYLQGASTEQAELGHLQEALLCLGDSGWRSTTTQEERELGEKHIKMQEQGVLQDATTMAM